MHNVRRDRFETLISSLVDELDGAPQKERFRCLLEAAARMIGDNRLADLKITSTTIDEMERSFNVLGLHSQRRKVSVFGSARSTEDSEIYLQAKEFSRLIAAKDYMVLTGAGPGVMAAGNEGAGRENSFGLGIRLPHETGSNRFIAGDVKDITFKYFFTRKLAFLKDSHAVVCCPGGFGTHDEVFEALTLIQTGKAQLMPVICIAPEGNPFWTNWDLYVRETLLKQGMISPADLSLYQITHDVDEAVNEIVTFYRRYHSYRFVNNNLIVRLTSPVTAEELEHLNQYYSDLLESGAIETAESPHGERFDSSLESLPALKIHFKMGRFGRLREMIDWLNSCDVDCPEVAPERGEGGRLPVEKDETTPP